MKDKIEAIKEWYAAQLSGEIRLFKGEENEMTTENIFNKLNHYDNLRRLEAKKKLRQSHKAQIDRAYYLNCQKWPLYRIRQREEFLAAKAKSEAA